VERLEAFHTSAPDRAGPHDGFRLFRWPRRSSPVPGSVAA
jgi:hypothetical protein